MEKWTFEQLVDKLAVWLHRERIRLLHLFEQCEQKVAFGF